MDRFATLEPVKLYDPKNSKPQKRIGTLPEDIHLLIANYLPIPDLPAYARASRATAAIVRNEELWKHKYSVFRFDKFPELERVVDDIEKKAASRTAKAPPVIAVDDEFGDFASAGPAENDLLGSFQFQLAVSSTQPSKSVKLQYVRVHKLLIPLLRFLQSPPHLVLSQLAEHLAPSLLHQARTLRLLSFFLTASLQPVPQWQTLSMSLRSAMDRFDSTLLAAFDVADGKADEAGMREAAESSWQIWDPANGDWELAKVWIEKREIFYQQGQWQPLDNFTKEKALDFDAMDRFMDHILAAIQEHGSRAIRIFPPPSQVIIMFCDRLANEVVGEYITTLLAHAREISIDNYLKSVAASFRESWKIVDSLLEVTRQQGDSTIPEATMEEIVYRMFEPNMDEYLDEEVENAKTILDGICRRWNRKVASSNMDQSARFLTSQNPALVKRNVLTSFTNLLLLPVTIVPRTVGAVGGAIITGGNAAVQGIAMLNPQRWAGGSTGYTEKIQEADESAAEADPAEKEEEEDIVVHSESSIEKEPAKRHQLDLLLSLDVALEIIHADREALKRIEIFAGYPGHCGRMVHDTIEEISITMFQVMGGQHVVVGFSHALERMQAYKPSEHSEVSDVAPLVQFFELVHMGDMIQSMVQVYFEKEVAPHIDKTDFLNPVVREKKKFENGLDDSVAGGLNAGTDVLMNQVDHIILSLTQPREYYPPEGIPMDLGPTKGCLAAIDCLEAHCKLLRGSTSKEVLEVFYQEVGLRLIGILQKHIKRQIISLQGGFQIIADLNAYNNFITSLKIPALNVEYSHLKMLGHVYIVEDAKDLAQIVRDVTRYGGAYRPEDIYEFIQRRSDWKKIEKIVDKTMYNLSFKEDCIIA